MKILLGLGLMILITSCTKGPMSAEDLKAYLKKNSFQSTKLKCEQRELASSKDNLSANQISFNDTKAEIQLKNPDCNIKLSLDYKTFPGGVLEMSNAQAVEWSCPGQKQNLGSYNHRTKFEVQGDYIHWTMLTGDQSCRLLKVM